MWRFWRRQPITVKASIDAVSCDDCGALVATQFAQTVKVGIEGWRHAWVMHYCRLHAKPYDERFASVAGELYYQKRRVQVNADGTPFAVSSTNEVK